jgi:Rrf2 family protein
MRALSETDVHGLNALHVLMRAQRPLNPGALATEAKAPTALLKAILPKLLKAGLIARLDRRGYILAKAPGEIRLEHVLEALDRPEKPSAPCGGTFDACPSRAACVLAVLCRKAEERFRETLREFTLEDLRDSPPDLPNCLDPAIQRMERAVKSRRR